MSLVVAGRLREVIGFRESFFRFVVAEDVLQGQDMRRRFDVRGIQFVELVDIFQYLDELAAQARLFLFA